MKKNILLLIKCVDESNTHISNLETLEGLLDSWESRDEQIVAKTTHNSHYDYKLFGHRVYQNPENHIDKYVQKDKFGHDVVYNTELDHSKTSEFIEERQKAYWGDKYKPYEEFNMIRNSIK